MENTENQNTATPGPEGAPASGATDNTAAPGAAPAAAKPAAKKPAKPSGKAPAKPKSGATEGNEEADAEKADPNPQAVEIWPLRSYQDAGEVKRRGGPSYTAPKRHADALIARGLASAEKPKNTK